MILLEKLPSYLKMKPPGVLVMALVYCQHSSSFTLSVFSVILTALDYQH